MKNSKFACTFNLFPKFPQRTIFVLRSKAQLVRASRPKVGRVPARLTYSLFLEEKYKIQSFLALSIYSLNLHPQRTIFVLGPIAQLVRASRPKVGRVPARLTYSLFLEEKYKIQSFLALSIYSLNLHPQRTIFVLRPKAQLVGASRPKVGRVPARLTYSLFLEEKYKIQSFLALSIYSLNLHPQRTIFVLGPIAQLVRAPDS